MIARQIGHVINREGGAEGLGGVQAGREEGGVESGDLDVEAVLPRRGGEVQLVLVVLHRRADLVDEHLGVGLRERGEEEVGELRGGHHGEADVLDDLGDGRVHVEVDVFLARVGHDFPASYQPLVDNLKREIVI